MYGHLDAGFSTGALENDIKAVFLAKLCQRNLNIFLRSAKLFFGSFSLVCRGQTMDLRGEPVCLGKVKACLIDIDGNNVRCTIRFGQRTGEKADRAHTKY
jgi:hypothetical protein